MEFSSFFPIWSKLTPEQRQLLQEGKERKEEVDSR